MSVRLLYSRTFFTYASEKMNIFTQSKDEYKKETYLELKSYNSRVAITNTA